MNASVRSYPGIRIVSERPSWVRLRVRGLLRNKALAARLEAAAPGQVRANAETGTLRAERTPMRDTAYWVDWLACRLRPAPSPSNPAPMGPLLEADAAWHALALDVLRQRPGDSVGADARLLEAHRLAANEAALTGESLLVRK